MKWVLPPDQFAFLRSVNRLSRRKDSILLTGPGCITPHGLLRRPMPGSNRSLNVPSEHG
jgi:hypothetical protein